MMTLAPINPVKTMKVHKILTHLLVVDMCARPCIVDDSKNVLTVSMLGSLSATAHKFLTLHLFHLPQ